MANTKVSALTELTGANVVTADDVMPIVDTSVTTTKKIKVDELAVSMAATQAEVNAMTSTNTLLTPNINKVVLGTLQASTSGTSIDFTSIPDGVRRITGSLVAVSTNGTSDIIVQIGDSGGVENSGYAGAASILNVGVATTNYTTGFGAAPSAAAGHVFHGTFTLTLIESSSNTWAFTSLMGRSDAANMVIGAGAKALSATLDRIRITTAGGTVAFDAGSINITLER